MCGIIGYIGEECADNLLEGLKQLQNRGYDSMGLVKIINSKFRLHKYASTPKQNAIDVLEENARKDSELFNTTISAGIAHSRWASTGGKTNANAHPHSSMKNLFTIVHNGIIENYKTVKDRLVNMGFRFLSQTDSEVIANLLEHEYSFVEIDESDIYIRIVKTIKRTFEQLEGTWGIALLCTEAPNTIYCFRHGSPLLVSSNESFAMCVSEQSGFCGKVENYYVLKNHDLCILRYDETSRKITMTTDEIYEHKKINISQSDCKNTTYVHWTLKEIMEQEDSSLRAISFGGRINKDDRVKLGGLDENRKILNKITNLIILGCGTSYYAALMGTHYFKDLCHFNCVQCINATEFTEKDIPLIGQTAFILMSQSGETKDLYNCLEMAKKNNIFMIGVINVVDSMIAREVNCGCYLNAGREVAVASTKSFTSQVIILSMIAIWFAQLKGINLEKRKYYISDLRKLNRDIKTTLDKSIGHVQQYLPYFEGKTSCFILGRGRGGEAAALESALKIKELSRIHAEGYSMSSLKHGPFALLEDDFPVILLAACNSSGLNTEYSKILNTYNEIAARNAKIIVVTNKEDCSLDNALVVPDNSTYAELLTVLPMQLLAYHLSLKRGINPDMPRNLAKVVTVE